MATDLIDAPATEVTVNPFASSRAVAAPPTSAGAAADTESQRAIAEVQAAIMLAKRFPRDQVEAMDRIISACCRPTLAESAAYSYTRGGSEVTGPSIRLAEALAQNWGNIQFGIRELAQGGGKSTVEAFAWDVETNTRQVKVFEVPHTRYTKSGTKALTDPRDIYEMVANQGARRLRACILGVIPGDVVDAAMEQCETTLRTKADVTPEGIKALVGAFAEIGVPADRIATKLGHKVDSIQPAELVRLRKVYRAIKDGYTTSENEFPSAEPAEAKAPSTAATAAAAAADKARKASAGKKEPAKPAEAKLPSAGDPRRDALEAMRLAVSKAADVETLEKLRKDANGYHDDGLFNDADLKDMKDLIHGKVELLMSEKGGDA